jgi:hypothetical protein
MVLGERVPAADDGADSTQEFIHRGRGRQAAGGEEICVWPANLGT